MVENHFNSASPKRLLLAKLKLFKYVHIEEALKQAWHNFYELLFYGSWSRTIDLRVLFLGILLTESLSPPFCAVRSLCILVLHPFRQAHPSPRSSCADIDILVCTVFSLYLIFLFPPFHQNSHMLSLIFSGLYFLFAQAVNSN